MTTLITHRGYRIISNFSDLGLSPDVLSSVADVGYKEPTPIQAEAIPVVLQGRDVLGCAQTGTGKTASFTLPMIDILASGRAKARMPRSLILCPTRELATQVAENFELYGKNTALSMALLIGGMAFTEQGQKLDRGVDVLIATPGRLLDHVGRGKMLLNDVKVLVIDEADRMLDMGFIPDVERIVSLLPKIRQTLFFSATLDRGIRKIADNFLINPKEITVAPPSSTADTVAQYIVYTDVKQKRDILRKLIDSEKVQNALIFCNRKRDVGIVQRSLARHGYDAVGLHGDMSQPARTETLARFKAGEARLLVASDVAARGLDIAELSHVFNFDVPTSAEDYVHRIGRTGRAGKTGRSLTIATRSDEKYVQAIHNLIKKSIEELALNGRAPAASGPAASGATSGPAASGPAASGTPSSRSEQGDASASEGATEAPRTRRTRTSKPKATEAEDKKETRPAQNRKSQNGKSGEKETRQNRQQGRQQGRHDDEETAPPVPSGAPTVGLGDHVPAFLLRPARPNVA